jgi:hypothetical protein
MRSRGHSRKRGSASSFPLPAPSRELGSRCTLAEDRRRRADEPEQDCLDGGHEGRAHARTRGAPRPARPARVLAPFPGLEPGALVTLGGVLVGRVASKTERGDTTFLGVRFNRGVGRLPGSHVVRLRRLGLNGEVALEIRPDRRGGTGSFVRGGLVRVLPADPPSPSEWPPMATPRGPPQSPPIFQLLPPAPLHRLRTSPTAT